MMSKKYSNTKFIYAFPGVGKTYFCKNTNIKNFIEISKPTPEPLKGEYLKAFVDSLVSYDGKVGIVFIEFDINIINKLNKFSDKVTLIYPQDKLRDEYIERYKKTQCLEFCNYMHYNWDSLLSEIKSVGYCNHIILASGSYISDFLG